MPRRPLPGVTIIDCCRLTIPPSGNKAVTGTRRNQVIMSAVGLRELAGAVGILHHP